MNPFRKRHSFQISICLSHKRTPLFQIDGAENAQTNIWDSFTGLVCNMPENRENDCLVYCGPLAVFSQVGWGPLHWLAVACKIRAAGEQVGWTFARTRIFAWKLADHARTRSGISYLLLIVERASGPLLLSRDVNKYCKFLWKNSSGVNYNRCVCA